MVVGGGGSGRGSTDATVEHVQASELPASSIPGRSPGPRQKRQTTGLLETTNYRYASVSLLKPSSTLVRYVPGK